MDTDPSENEMNFKYQSGEIIKNALNTRIPELGTHIVETIQKNRKIFFSEFDGSESIYVHEC